MIKTSGTAGGSDAQTATEIVRDAMAERARLPASVDFQKDNNYLPVVLVASVVVVLIVAMVK